MLGNHLIGIQFCHTVPQDYRIWLGWCFVMPHQFAISPRWWHCHCCHQHRGRFSVRIHWLYPNNSCDKSGDYWETQRDPMIQKVHKFLRHSWPPDLTGDLQQFKWYCDFLSIIDDCLMVVDCIVVPTKLGKAVLKQRHTGYPGINRMKAIACSVVYWPNVDSDIKKTVKHR